MRALLATLALLVLAAPHAAALALPDPVPPPVRRAALAVDRAATSLVHETLEPLEPREEVHAASGPPAAAADAPREASWAHAAPPTGATGLALAAGVGACLVGAVLARRRGLPSRLARALALLVLLAAAGGLAVEAWHGAAAPLAFVVLAWAALVAGALALRRLRSAPRAADAHDPAFA